MSLPGDELSLWQLESIGRNGKQGCGFYLEC